MDEYNTDEFFAEERYEQSICMTCANEMNCDGKNEIGVVVWCTKYAGKYSKPKSNGDRIRSMTDEELADIITDDWCELLNCKSPCDGHCDLKVLEWLKISLGTDNSDRCVCCGEPVPEGRMVCPTCERRANE